MLELLPQFEICAFLGVTLVPVFPNIYRTRTLSLTVYMLVASLLVLLFLPIPFSVQAVWLGSACWNIHISQSQLWEIANCGIKRIEVISQRFWDSFHVIRFIFTCTLFEYHHLRPILSFLVTGHDTRCHRDFIESIRVVICLSFFNGDCSVWARSKEVTENEEDD